MVLLRNSFEGGTAGTTITAANSGGQSGDAFSGVLGTPVYAADAAHGTKGYQANANSTSVYWSGRNDASFGVRFYFRLLATPSVAGIAFRVYNVNTNGDLFRIVVNTSRQLQLQNSNGQAVFFTTVPTLALSTWYRIEFWGSRNTGACDVRVYAGDDTASPVGSYSVASGFAYGGLNLGRVDFGRISGIGWGSGPQFDDVAYQDSATAIGPAITPPPTATANGAWTFAGNATGTRKPSASGSGAWTTTGNATGKRNPVATGSGAWSFVGTADGRRAPKATGAGAWSWAGAATGRRSPTATGSGAWSWTDAAIGTRAPAASGAGQWTSVGRAASKRTPKAIASGDSTSRGTADGYRSPLTCGAGGWPWDGTAIGFAPVVAPPGHLAGASTLAAPVASSALAGDGVSVSQLEAPPDVASVVVGAVGDSSLLALLGVSTLTPAVGESTLTDAGGQSSIDTT